MQTYYFLASFAFRSKVIVIVKRSMTRKKIHSGSGSRIQVVKKHRIPDPDPQHYSPQYRYRAKHSFGKLVSYFDISFP
jgi:hypothetical protein